MPQTPLWHRGMLAPALLTLLVLLPACAGCKCQRIGVIHRVSLDFAQGTQYDSLTLRASAISRRPVDGHPPPPPPVNPKNKLHPALQAWLGLAGADTTQWQVPIPPSGLKPTMVPLIIALRDTLASPTFPALTAYEDDSLQYQADLDRVFATLDARHEVQYRQLREDLRAINALRTRDTLMVVDTFDLSPSAIVLMPLDSTLVFELANLDYVIAIEPRTLPAPPPSHEQHAYARYSVGEGRRRIASDPYYNELIRLGRNSGRIGLLDAGIDPTVEVLQGQIRYVRDCFTNTDVNCTGQASVCRTRPLHGTLSAAIITAANTGSEYRGVTDFTLDSWRVFNESCQADPDAVDRAFKAAIRAGNEVILAEIQLPISAFVEDKANVAYESGRIVIATNGNTEYACPISVASPASAHGAIGVGAYMIENGNTEINQSLGPTKDLRIKPELQAPTSTTVMINGVEQEHGATSGAAPYVAGAAALLRNWMLHYDRSLEPGHVYAVLILSGQRAFPNIDNTRGTGELRLPTDGWLFWGKQMIDAGMTLNIPIDIGNTTPSSMNAAIWWYEGRTQPPHHDIDLFLIAPNNHRVASSKEPKSVFERVQVAGDNLPSGRWILRLESATDWDWDDAEREVFWALHVIPQ